MRINRFIARSGICSRREADNVIRCGRVTVNGNVLSEVGYTVKPEDKVELDGKPLAVPMEYTYVMLNKPRGYTCTLDDRFAEHKVIDLLPPQMRRLSIVGRLDQDSRGLVLLTDDGESCYRLTHPSFEVEKEYIVELKGEVVPSDLEQACRGIEDDGETLCIDRYEIVRSSGVASTVKVVLHQGRKRELRRIFKHLGFPVKDLLRVRIGSVTLGTLTEGEFKVLGRIV
jgi:23S rRNA pseudouridine2605 synthase